MCNIVKPVIDYSVRGLCRKPYTGHVRGCPNWHNLKRKQCPPHGPKIEEIIDINKEVFCIYNIFPIGEHIIKMREKHPFWSERQLACCLYWQPKARKQLREKIKDFLRSREDRQELKIVDCPEGCGVNVTETMKQLGIELEWPPKVYAYQVVLMGYKKGEN